MESNLSILEYFLFLSYPVLGTYLKYDCHCGNICQNHLLSWSTILKINFLVKLQKYFSITYYETVSNTDMIIFSLESNSWDTLRGLLDFFMEILIKRCVKFFFAFYDTFFACLFDKSLTRQKYSTTETYGRLNKLYSFTALILIFKY